jgi:hypothetical protein
MPTSRAMLAMIATFAQFDAEVVSERRRDALAWASMVDLGAVKLHAPGNSRASLARG